MSVKYGNPSATYNIPLNTSENDIFRIGCAHLYHFLHINVKTDDCKPMMLKMHLELDDSPSTREAEEGNIEHNNSITGLRQSLQQLEEEIKTLRDALLQAKKDNAINRIDKAPDVDNNAAQELNSSKDSPSSSGETEERNIEHNNSSSNAMRQSLQQLLSSEHNNTENIVSASELHHTSTIPKEKPKAFDLRRNCVYIRDLQCSDSSLKMAFRNIRKLAYEMNVEIPEDSVIHIDVEKNFYGNLDYYVYFCNAGIKEEFLKNRHIYVYNPKTSPLRIFDYSDWGIVDIRKFNSADLSLETAYADVIKIVKKMGITLERELTDYIDHIDTFSTSEFITSYSIQFNNEFIRQKFLRRKDALKQFPKTKNFQISDGGGHRLNVCNINNVVSVASAIVIGVAELIGLSLATHNLKRIYVLHNFGLYHDIVVGFSLIVELSSKQVKDEFLEKIYKLEEKEHLKSIEISDINAEKNIILIKYKYGPVATAISFIGLAKQLQCSLNPDQIEYFFDLSKFIDDTKRSKDK